MGTGGPAGLLLERDREIAEFEAMLADSGAGEGRIALIQGDPGIGKTRLMQALRESAHSKGFSVLSARGGELERDFAFGLVRQLFEPALNALEDDARGTVTSGAASLTLPLFELGGASDAPPDVFGTLHGLYWLTANLAEIGPLLLAVDDAHWADEPSLRFLDFLVRRMEGLPVLLAIAFRYNEPGTDKTVLAHLEQNALVRIIRPTGLSEEAVGIVIDNDLGWEPKRELRKAAHQATGGNPFLLGEVLAELRLRGVEPASAASEISELAPDRIAAGAAARLNRLGGAAPALARAVAVLGPDAEIELAARLAEIESEAAAAAAEDLVDARILAPGRPLSFVHPVVRTAIYATMAVSERVAAHTQAARHLADTRADADAIATHLLESEPKGDAWVVATLSEAARSAIVRGAPEVASRLLRRALAEPPPRSDVGPLLVDLGTVLGQSGALDAVQIFNDALRYELDPQTRAKAQLRLSAMLYLSTRFIEASAVLYRAIEELGDSNLELRYELEGLLLVGALGVGPVRQMLLDRLRRVQAEVEAGATVPKTMVALLAMEEYIMGGSAAQCAAVAREALDGDSLLNNAGSDSPNLLIGTCCLALAGDEPLANDHFSRSIAASQSRGSSRGFAAGSVGRGWVRYRMGEIDAAEADVRAALEQGVSELRPVSILGAAVLIDVFLDRGLVEGAQKTLNDADLTLEDEEFILAQLLRESRSRLRLEQGRAEEALADATAIGSLLAAWDSPQSPLVPWRTRAALALQALGRLDEARHLAGEQLHIARTTGPDGFLGIALRTAGVLDGGKSTMDLLEEAVDAHGRSHSRLEYARSIYELASAHRRQGDRARARELHRSVMEEAHRCGAAALVERARSELVGLGARPRRFAVIGRDALTATERRIADAAATGLTNREIAQSFFVTTKTVETHMRAVFQKLGIRSRTQLPDGLGVVEES